MLPAEVKHIACRCVEDEGHEEVDQIAEQRCKCQLLEYQQRSQILQGVGCNYDHSELAELQKRRQLLNLSNMHIMCDADKPVRSTHKNDTTLRPCYNLANKAAYTVNYISDN